VHSNLGAENENSFFALSINSFDARQEPRYRRRESGHGRSEHQKSILVDRDKDIPEERALRHLVRKNIAEVLKARSSKSPRWGCFAENGDGEIAEAREVINDLHLVGNVLLG
jgi:hypothetical protein